MNTKQLSKQVGKLFRLRPQPLRIGDDGRRLPPRDDMWRLDDVQANPARVRLVNVATHHAVELEWDNIQERRSPDYLMLRCQLLITKDSVAIEPIHRGSPIQPELPDPPAKYTLHPDGTYRYKVRARGFEDRSREFTTRLIRDFGIGPIGSVFVPSTGWTQMEFVYTGRVPPDQIAILGMKYGMAVETEAVSEE